MAETLRVGIYGAGRFANRTHLPNLQKMDGVDVVAACDVNEAALNATADQFGIPMRFRDGHEMLEKAGLHVLYSVVPAFARTDVEARAAGMGIHLFSEKPQSTQMAVARQIDVAIRASGVLSTVSFRERYRPFFQEAKRLLSDKDIVHCEFHRAVGSPHVAGPDEPMTWHRDFSKHGGLAFDWGVHAMDYIRFMTGLNVVRAQAFYHLREDGNARSSAFNFAMDSGATANLTFVAADGAGGNHRPWFAFYFEGGYLETYGYERIVMNGEEVYRGEAFDPWFEQTRVFIQAVKTNDGTGLLNDYRDGLFSLAPILAGWASSRRGGDVIDIGAFMEA